MSDSQPSSQVSLRSAAAVSALTAFAMTLTVLRLGDLPITVEPVAALHVDRVADEAPAPERIRDITDRLARGALTFDPDGSGEPAERILSVNLGRGFSLLCAERGPELQAEFLIENDGLLYRPEFDAQPFNDRLAPTCARILA